MSRIRVAVETPLHAGMGDLLDYESEHELAPGSLVLVPLGRRVVPGVVWGEAPASHGDAALHELRPVSYGVPKIMAVCFFPHVLE